MHSHCAKDYVNICSCVTIAANWDCARLTSEEMGLQRLGNSCEITELTSIILQLKPKLAYHPSTHCLGNELHFFF